MVGETETERRHAAGPAPELAIHTQIHSQIYIYHHPSKHKQTKATCRQTNIQRKTETAGLGVKIERDREKTK